MKLRAELNGSERRRRMIAAQRAGLIPAGMLDDLQDTPDDGQVSADKVRAEPYERERRRRMIAAQRVGLIPTGMLSASQEAPESATTKPASSTRAVSSR